MNPVTTVTPTATHCYHCGDPCPTTEPLIYDEQVFCCQGCQTVYTLLQDHQLGQFYQMERDAGGRPRSTARYEYLDEAEIRGQLLDYHDEQRHQLQVHLPAIHCSACVWLLEHLYQLLPGVQSCRVNFLKRTAMIAYDPQQVSLRELVECLDRIGYPPELRLDQTKAKSTAAPTNRQAYYRLGVAGFAFGNIMLLSFPEYFGLSDANFIRLFGYLNLLLALPVLLYAAYDYWHAAYWSLRQGRLNIDVPITLGMLALFVRSTFEVLTHTGAGYFDSLAGLVFFLLVGKWFQQRTYEHLSFERDYSSYFPLAVQIKTPEGTSTRSLQKLEVGEVMLIRNGELIPADGVLLSGPARIDYSFVTGEAEPVRKAEGDTLFAGGRQCGAPLEVAVRKTVSQSYLTQLWNDSAFQQTEQQHTRLADRMGRWFTWVILLVATASLLYWLPADIGKAINAFSAVLIIACPCAIALSIPFTYGNILRRLGRMAYFLKNIVVVERLQTITDIVFDKTGTLTDPQAREVSFVGQPLTKKEKQWVQCLTHMSTHPLSRQLAADLPAAPALSVADFTEVTGQGISAQIDGQTIRLGSTDFMLTNVDSIGGNGNRVYLEINHQARGVFVFRTALRTDLLTLLSRLGTSHQIHLLSGDQDREAERFSPMFGGREQLHFSQQPQDKLDFIKALQANGKQVLMIGDGLNDAGALQQAEVGLVVTDDTNNFTPACDGILAGDQLRQLPSVLTYAKAGRYIVYGAYALALLYNIIGLSYAVQAQLSPVIAAILMPLSSVTIIAFGVLLSTGVTNVIPGINQSQCPT